ncbi:hypothetical protein P692DRAFT_20297221 [Suillus brevipes Sb2]|nr:hypothetical protein P692DRAFT_20297221 [Suillus brevipes Sb2]
MASFIINPFFNILFSAVLIGSIVQLVRLGRHCINPNSHWSLWLSMVYFHVKHATSRCTDYS